MLLGCFDGELPMLLGRNAQGSSGFWRTWKAVEDGSIGGIVSVGGGFSPRSEEVRHCRWAGWLKPSPAGRGPCEFGYEKAPAARRGGGGWGAE